MHELAICQAIVAQVEEVAAARRAYASSITLCIGPLSGVEPELLRHAYPLASAGTRSATAELHIETAAVRVRCRCCGHESQVAPNRLLCAQCGDWNTQLLSGDELLLTKIEMELQPAFARIENRMSEGSGAR